jgi:exopolyphosphatase/guanosine-5'-triphosphate,3'-diphosphate pyrophosphatase
VTRVAAIDCGTNSLRLLVADLDPAAGTLVDVDRRMEVVRLGEGVDRTGRLSPAALRRTQAGLARFVALTRRLGVERVRMVATSATRDAANRLEFVDMVRDTLGAEPEVVTGDEEAALSFAGATRELASRGVGEPPYLVFDVGGGSTEIVLGGVTSPHLLAAISVDVGCVRLTERHLQDDPPGVAQVAALTADVDVALDRAAVAVPLDRAATVVGVAGTVTTLGGMALGLDRYDAKRIHGTRIPPTRVGELTDQLLAMTHDERAAVPVMHPGRVDVIAAGAVVVRRLVERVGLPDLVVSEHDILDGLAWSLQ